MFINVWYNPFMIKVKYNAIYNDYNSLQDLLNAYKISRSKWYSIIKLKTECGIYKNKTARLMLEKGYIVYDNRNM